MIIKAQRILLKENSNWGYDVTVRILQYKSRINAKRGIAMLRRNGWRIDTAYPTKDFHVVATKRAA